MKPIAYLALIASAFVTTSAQAAQWWLHSVNGSPAAAQASLEIGPNGELSGLAGCNRYQGTVRSVEGDLVVDGPLATTKMACPPGVVSDQDDQVISLLSGRIETEFDPVSHRLILSANGVTAVYTDTGSDMGGPDEQATGPDVTTAGHVIVVGVDSALNIRAGSSTTSAVLGRARLGSLFANGGCDAEEGRVWCHVRALDTTDLQGFAAAEFLAPAIAARRAASGVFDRIGRLTCTGPDMLGGTKCDYGLARDTAQTASIVVYLPDGSVRQFDAIEGVFSIEGESGLLFSQQNQDGTRIVDVGEERYELPANLFEDR